MPPLIIKYCQRCGERIPAADFEEGTAVLFKNKSYCKSCSLAVLSELERSTSAAQKPTVPLDLRTPRKLAAAVDKPVATSRTARRVRVTTAAQRWGWHHSPVRSRDRLPLIISTLACIALILMVGIYLLMVEQETPSQTTLRHNTKISSPASAGYITPRVIQQARQFARRNPTAYRQIVTHWRKACEKCRGTKMEKEARTELQKAQQKLNAKGREVYEQTLAKVKQLCLQGQFQEAERLWQAFPPELLTSQWRVKIGIQQQLLQDRRRQRTLYLPQPIGTNIDPRRLSPGNWQPLLENGRMLGLRLHGSWIKKGGTLTNRESREDFIISSRQSYANCQITLDFYIHKGCFEIYPRYIQRPNNPVVTLLKTKNSQTWDYIELHLYNRTISLTTRRNNRPFHRKQQNNFFHTDGPAPFLIHVPPGSQVSFARILVKESTSVSAPTLGTLTLTPHKWYPIIDQHGFTKAWRKTDGWYVEDHKVIGENLHIANKTTLAIFHNLQWQDYEFTFKVQKVQGLFLVLVRILNLQRGQFHKIVLRPELFQDKRWHTINVKVAQDRVCLKVDEKFKTETIRPELQNGGLALVLPTGARVEIKDMVFRLDR